MKEEARGIAYDSFHHWLNPFVKIYGVVISINMKEIDNNDIISAELIALFAHQNKAE